MTAEWTLRHTGRSVDESRSLHSVPGTQHIVTDPDAESGKLAPTSEALLALVILMLGLAFRMGQYLANRSIWFDEALLALNILQRSFGGLLQPLSYNQGAPLGFLLLQKLVVVTIGSRDYMLRLIPFAAGIGSLYLLFRVARYYIAGTAWIAALFLFSVSDPLIYYASEIKQYSTDVAVGLLLLLVAALCLERGTGVRRYTLLGCTGALALVVSHPALFVLGGIAVTLFLHTIAEKDWRSVRWLLWIGAAWLGTFLLLYIVSLQSLSNNHELEAYWTEFFMPVPPWQNWRWFPDRLLGIMRHPVGLSLTWLSVLLVLVGIVSLFWRSWQKGLILVLPLVATAAASGLGKYPFGGRLLLFLVPLILMLLGEAIERIRLLLEHVNGWLSWIATLSLIALLAYTPFANAVQKLKHPRMVEEIKPLMSHIVQNKQMGDSIYVYYGAQFAFQYYAPQFGFDAGDYIVGIESRSDPANYAPDVENLDGGGRTWIVFSHVYNWAGVDEKVVFLQDLDRLGIRLDEIHATGASLYLYDL